MIDPSLAASLLKGLPTSNKSSSQKKAPQSASDIALEEEVDNYLAAHPLAQDPSRGTLLTPEAQRAKLRAELIEKAKKQDVSSYIKEAIDLVHKRVSHLLNSKDDETLQKDLDQAAQKIAQLDVKQLTNSPIQDLLEISDTSMDALFKIGVALFAAKDYAGSMAMFTLLTTLNDESAEYWFRVAIAAQLNNNSELALRGYRNAIAIDQHFITAEIFCAQYCLTQGLKAEAEDHFRQAEKISKSTDVAPEWQKLLEQLASSFKPK